jgi:hypothetical protein
MIAEWVSSDAYEETYLAIEIEGKTGIIAYRSDAGALKVLLCSLFENSQAVFDEESRHDALALTLDELESLVATIRSGFEVGS